MYQALDDLQQLLHDNRDALVAEQPADDLEVRGPHEVAVAAVNAGVGQVQSLRTQGACCVRTPGRIHKVAPTHDDGAWLCKGALNTQHPGVGEGHPLNLMA